jgi:hypothetical protein
MSGTAGSSGKSPSLSTAASPDSSGKDKATRVVIAVRCRLAGTYPADRGDKPGASPLVEQAAVARRALASSRSRRFAQPIESLSPSPFAWLQGEHHVEDAQRIANLTARAGAD